MLVAVRDLAPDEHNPLTTEQTVEILRAALEGEDAEVVVIPDIESVNWGRGVGYAPTEHVPPPDVARISATEIRKEIRSGSTEWRSRVPEAAHAVVERYLS